MNSLLISISHLIPPNSASAGALILALAITVGLVLGGIRVHGLRLGISAVLFSALAFGQLGLTVTPQVLSFLRDFSLILFVYAIGLQVGPGFFDSLRAEGLRLNVLALIAIALGAVLTCGIASLPHVARDSAAGLFAGGYTTTPGLAAGQEVLRQAYENRPGGGDAALATTGLAYAVTYPFGVFGPALVILIVKRLFRVNISAERSALATAEQSRRLRIVAFDFEVTSPEHAGKTLRHHPLFQGRGVVLSRLLRDAVVSVPTADTEIRMGDVYRAVGPQPEVARVAAAMGREATMPALAGNIQREEIVVTRTRVLHRSLRELDLSRRTGVTITSVSRSGIDLIPSASLRLKFGDRLGVIGPMEGLKQVEEELGNSPDALNQIQLIPIFLGVVLGVLVGSIPIRFPGLSLPMRIGLAGGPMLAAIALSQLGSLGAVVWYLPVSANQLIRDFGLAVFLACVGFESGGNFLQRVVHGGFVFILWGAAITVLPVLLVAIYARVVMRMNFVTLAGWIAGAMTSTPALLFASEYTGSESPAVAYAAVAPLSILSPVICAQLLVMWLMR